jgi:hypothetical protein
MNSSRAADAALLDLCDEHRDEEEERLQSSDRFPRINLNRP